MTKKYFVQFFIINLILIVSHCASNYIDCKPDEWFNIFDINESN